LRRVSGGAMLHNAKPKLFQEIFGGKQKANKSQCCITMPRRLWNGYCENDWRACNSLPRWRCVCLLAVQVRKARIAKVDLRRELQVRQMVRKNFVFIENSCIELPGFYPRHEYDFRKNLRRVHGITQ